MAPYLAHRTLSRCLWLSKLAGNSYFILMIAVLTVRKYIQTSDSFFSG